MYVKGDVGLIIVPSKNITNENKDYHVKKKSACKLVTKQQ